MTATGAFEDKRAFVKIFMDGVLQGGVIFNLLPNGVDMTKNGPPDTDQLLDLVGNLYASALDPSAATEALNALCRSLGGAATQIYTYDKGSGTVLASQTNDVINEDRNDQYIRHWGALDPRPVALASLPSGGIIRCHESFDEKYVARSSFYQDFFIPNGFRWAIGGMFDSGDGTSTVVAGLRDPDAPPFEPWTEKLLAQLLPHYRRAADLHRKMLQVRTNTLDVASVIEALPAACLVVDMQGRVLFVNDAASSALAAVSSRLAGPFLRFTDMDLQAQWLAALRQVVALHVGTTIRMPPRDDQSRMWSMHLAAWHGLARKTDGLERHLVIVTFEPSERNSEMALRRLADKAGLTAAEREVLALLLDGGSTKLIARRRGSTVNTVRSQIAAILDKTGCHSQLELVAKLRRL
jgi:DNA-binding CsgD family transcriptional regulator